VTLLKCVLFPPCLVIRHIGGICFVGSFFLELAPCFRRVRFLVLGWTSGCGSLVTRLSDEGVYSNPLMPFVRCEVQVVGSGLVRLECPVFEPWCGS
jgi:hypothetical protein